MFKILITKTREYIFIILTATIFLLTFTFESISEENIFIIDNVRVEGQLDVNFSRDRYINKAFLDSFQMLMSKILLSKDLTKLSNINIDHIKNLINSFQIKDESYQNDLYNAVFKIFYNDAKVKKLLVKENISYSEPKNISAVFFPVLFVNGKLLDFSENYFYKRWAAIEIENEIINFILPIEDLDDILKMEKMKNEIENFELEDLIEKYNTKNYAFVMMDYENNKLSLYLKTNFNNNKKSKNISYSVNNLNDENKLDSILKELKIKITDIWKSENIINLTSPLSINVEFKYDELKDLKKLKNTFYKISIIDKYSLEELNINHSFFKIYYFGNPKKLSTELLDFGYHLKNDQGKWELYEQE